MRRLDIEYKTNGTEYKLFRRSEKVALYKQYSKEGDLIAYELFKIHKRPQETIKGIDYPEREIFASNQQFGLDAWAIPVRRGEDYVIKRFESYDKEVLNCDKYNQKEVSND